jgi:DedD protein
VNNKTKERIVGSVVLLCLAIIFIPPFYDGRNPFDLEKDVSLTQIPREPYFKDTEDSAADIAEIGSGRIDDIEKKVKESLPESAQSDSQLKTDPTNTYSEKLEDFNASEMTGKLLNEISKSSEISARFNNKSTVKQAWAVQVGSFGEAARAQKLRDELIAKKFQAYIKTSSKNGATISRVFAGVSLDKSVAEKIKLDLENNYSVTTAIVVPYQP